jgi:ribosomal protein S18 acetylase RimI-like enzyme
VARITDIDRLATLAERALRSPVSADLLRQLTYLPQASIFVVESGRDLAGGVVMALRPSVRQGGFVGTIDLLVVDPDRAPEPTADALLAEALRSALNKGCAVVEAARPDDQVELARLERSGFVTAGVRLARSLA